MATQQCPTCGEWIDDDAAELCPNCGEAVGQDGLSAAELAAAACG